MGIGWVGEYHSPGTSPWGTGVSTMGQMGLPVCAVEHIKVFLLGGLRDGLDGLAVDVDVGEHRGARNIHIPQAVVNQLIVPDALAGMQIHGKEGFAEEAVAGPMAAVEIAGGQFHGQVDHVEFFVDGDLSPDAGVAGIGPGIFSHVSMPNSPGLGMVWKIQRRLPVWTSKPRT